MYECIESQLMQSTMSLARRRKKSVYEQAHAYADGKKNSSRHVSDFVTFPKKFCIRVKKNFQVSRVYCETACRTTFMRQTD